MSLNYLRVVEPGDLDGPPCHVCGAIMVPLKPTNQEGWECLCCGTTTLPTNGAANEQ